MADETEDKPKSRAPKKPQRVEVIDKKGNIANPLKRDLDKWLAAGWTPTKSAEQAD